MRVTTRRNQPVTTIGYDAFWHFAAERQEIYMRRLAGQPIANITDDVIIAANRFTNAYRASDRVSQYLIRSVQYNQQWNWLDTFVRTLVFKIFNRLDTWQHLLMDIGEPDCNLLFDRAIDSSIEQIANEQPVYSAAYIMPPPRSTSGPKYVRHLTLLRNMVNEGIHLEIQEAPTMGHAYAILHRYDSIGDFLAYQFITDLNYSPHLDFSEQEFVVPGPGAIRGLRKCFSDIGDLSDCDLIRWTLERQHEEFNNRGLNWKGLWGRDLQLIDIQNLFCEVDKYTRVAIPELAEFAPGIRIKQRYRPNPSPLTAWFPPKWEINDHVRLTLTPNEVATQQPLFPCLDSVHEDQLALV